MWFCALSVVVVVDAELEKWSVRGVRQTEERIVSRWKEVRANEKHELRDEVDKILRPLGDETRLVVMERTNNIVLCFVCMTLTAVMGLRDLWRSQQLRDILKSLFNVLSVTDDDDDDDEDDDDGGVDVEEDDEEGDNDEDDYSDEVNVETLTWPLAAYERCLGFISSVQG